MKIKAISLALCFGMLFTGCNNMQKGAGIGAGGGAVLGGIIGKIAGNTAVGAAIGAAVGAGTGAIIGKRMDKVKAEAAQVKNAQVETVKDTNGLDAVKVSFDSAILLPPTRPNSVRVPKTRWHSSLRCLIIMLTSILPSLVIPIIRVTMVLTSRCLSVVLRVLIVISFLVV